MRVSKPYKGTTRTLVISFDVGTTYSGSSYAVLEPSMTPEVKGVTRFPGALQVTGDAKIPTVIYYDLEGRMRAAGAEAVDDATAELAKQHHWVLCRLFKLHLKPPSNASDTKQAIEALPLGKDIVDIYSDFLGYLMACTSKFIKDSTPGGELFWLNIEDSIEFVLTHPNGWGGLEQQLLRQAAVLANLVEDNTQGHARVHFVTEGEASLHFCIMSGLNMPKSGVMIADAGGGTVDLSAYCPVQGRTRYEEVAVPVSLFCGSAYVTDKATKYFEEKLAKTRFEHDIPRITSVFDTGAKMVFKCRETPAYVTFGSFRDTDESLNIRSGRLKIPGTVVASFFNPSVKAIVRAVSEQKSNIETKVVHVFLVGGFAANEWLFCELQKFLQPLGIIVLRPDRYVSKAVTDGAISFYLDHLVTARVSKKVFGAECIRDYIPNDPEHRNRSSEIQFSCTGKRELHYGFDVILGKGERVMESQEFRRPYFLERKTLTELHSVTADIMVYDGDIQNPKWLDQDSGNFVKLCTVYADTTLACQGLHARSMNRKQYYRFDYEIILSFGLTELRAQVCWRERGVEKRGPAKIVYHTCGDSA